MEEAGMMFYRISGISALYGHQSCVQQYATTGDDFDTNGCNAYGQSTSLKESKCVTQNGDHCFWVGVQKIVITTTLGKVFM